MKVFISHSSSDKRFVRTIKSDLNENGIETFLDEDSLELGDSLVEKLELAIQDSSHFIIILSPSSLKSEWVTQELNFALKLMSAKLIKKIIPIKYRSCEIPKELENLIYADLSNQIVQIEGDRVKFITDGYSRILISLIGTIKSNKKMLSNVDKKNFIEEVLDIENRIDAESSDKIKTRHNFIGYIDEHWYSFYQRKVYSTGKFSRIAEKDIRPVVLPSIYKGIFKGIKIGDTLQFKTKQNVLFEGQFCSFRNKDNAIAIPNEMREKLNIEKGVNYSLVINLKDKLFDLISD